MKRIFGYYLRPYYGRMAGGFLVKFCGTVLDLFLPWALANMIDRVIPAGNRQQILGWGVFMAVCSVLAVTLSVTANRMASRVAADAIFVIREDLFQRIMHLPDADCDSLTRPSLISRLTADTYNVHQLLARMQRLGVRAPILLTGGIGMMLMLDPVLALVLMSALPVLALVVYMVSRVGIPMFAALQESADRLVRLVREDIAGMRVIRALCMESFENERFRQINQEAADRERNASVTAAITNPSMNLFLNLGLAAVVVVGAYRVNSGQTEVGTILAFLTYFTIILTAMMSISRMFLVISKAAASAGRIAAVLEREPENQGEPDAGAGAGAAAGAEPSTGTPAPCLEFDHVSFSYNKIRSNLSDIQFSLNPGETLGIIGATGSGKTTIANLLMGFYQPDQGEIRLNGKNIQEMGKEALRSRFGVVFQNDVMFEDTIGNNICLGRTLTEKQLLDAVSSAQAEDFVMGRGGLDAPLDIRGANLSGGQKQRIFIARALASRPEILILDDASSALDYRTDAALRRALREEYAGTTCIVIAQRVSSVMHADHILVLEDGAEIGYGTHEELLETCPVYREIRDSQMGLSGKEGQDADRWE